MKDLPPCLKAILTDKARLKKHYIHILRYVNQYKPESFSQLMLHLLNEGVQPTITIEALQPFSCQELQEFCSEACPIYEGIYSWLMDNTENVYKVQNENDEVILKVIFKDGNSITLNLSSESLGRQFVSQIAMIYGRYVDLDLRRRSDKEKWNTLMKFWVSKAKPINLSCIDEEDELIRNVCLEYLYSVLVRPKEDWHGDPNVAVAANDGYALFLKESLRSYASQYIKKRVSMKRLTLLLKPDVESVWVKVHGVRYPFYKFKMSEAQKKELETYLRMKKKEEELRKDMEKYEEVSREEDEELIGSDYSEWSLDEVLGD